ncbi:MAG: hypothetical protein R3F22_08540 [Lysobacteraceae bacterium]
MRRIKVSTRNHRVAVAAALLLSSVPLLANAWFPIRRIDVRPDGLPISSGQLSAPSFSADGRWLVFSSDSSELVANDGNNVGDVFVMDTSNGVVTRPLRRVDGSETASATVYPVISTSGRFIAFLSGDSQLVTGDSNGRGDIFVLDRDVDGDAIFDEAGQTSIQRASVDAAGGQLIPGVDNVKPAISADGSQVAFATLALIDPTDDNSEVDVYLRDLTAGTTVLVSASSAGVVGDAPSPGFFASPLRMDNAGRFVAFASEAENLVGDDDNNRDDVFVRDRDTDEDQLFDEDGDVAVFRASVGPAGAQADRDSRDFDISGDGDWLVFSQSNSLLLPDDNPGNDIYIHHLPTGTITVADISASPVGKTEGGNQYPLTSADGKVTIFQSSQNYTFEVGGSTTITGRSDALAWVIDEMDMASLQRITDYPVPADRYDGWSASPLALSDNGRYIVLSTRDSEPGSQQRWELVDRLTIFRGGFDP